MSRIFRQTGEQVEKITSKQGWYYNETYCELSLWIVRASQVLCMVIIYSLVFVLLLVGIDAESWWDINYSLLSKDQNNVWVWVNQMSLFPLSVCMDVILLT